MSQSPPSSASSLLVRPRLPDHLQTRQALRRVFQVQGELGHKAQAEHLLHHTSCYFFTLVVLRTD